MYSSDSRKYLYSALEHLSIGIFTFCLQCLVYCGLRLDIIYAIGEKARREPNLTTGYLHFVGASDTPRRRAPLLLRCCLLAYNLEELDDAPCKFCCHDAFEGEETPGNLPDGN